MWVEVDGEPMPVYHIEYTKEGPEAWIPVPEGKVGAPRPDDNQVALALIIIHALQEYVVKQNTRKKDPNVSRKSHIAHPLPIPSSPLFRPSSQMQKASSTRISKLPAASTATWWTSNSVA